MFLEMKVFGITLDPFTNAPIVILKDLDDKKSLPVWIGVLEASAIASELEKIRFSRPMTHDLMKAILNNLSINVEKIEVTDLKDNVYYARIYLKSPGNSIILDSRPSDAIALALRMECPIYVDSSVIDKSRKIDLREEAVKKGAGNKELLEILEDLAPDEFGKYKM
ncbi:MAG: bifunctional nuclease family protein [Thermodesulfobacteriota bacterium]|nr:MAG: bifunctional nuclease family protein [Thermodesulfobacteriota bacterium]